jgi:hypothetical protein
MVLQLTQFAPVGFDRYRQEYKIVANRRPAQEIVAKLNLRPEQSGFGSAASGTLRQRAEQIVRFARPNILFHDEHVIDLYHRICAPVSNGVKMQRKNRTAIRPQKTSHETRFALGHHLAKLEKRTQATLDCRRVREAFGF